MIPDTHAANFVTIFGLIYKLQLFELKSTFISNWTSSVQLYWHLLVFLWLANWVMKMKCIFRLCKDGFGAKVIRASYPNKNCCRVDEMCSAVMHHTSSSSNTAVAVLLQLVNILNTV